MSALPHWSPIYVGAREGLDHLELPTTVEEAARVVLGFVERIDAASDYRGPLHGIPDK